MGIAGLTAREGSRAAAALGVMIASLGAVLAIFSIAATVVSGSGGWLLLMLPALALMKLGSMVHNAAHGSPAGPRKNGPEKVRRTPVQDFARHNRAWENVARWEERYGPVRRGERSTGKPQRKLEAWSLRLKR